MISHATIRSLLRSLTWLGAWDDQMSYDQGRYWGAEVTREWCWLWILITLQTRLAFVYSFLFGPCVHEFGRLRILKLNCFNTCEKSARKCVQLGEPRNSIYAPLLAHVRVVAIQYIWNWIQILNFYTEDLYSSTHFDVWRFFFDTFEPLFRLRPVCVLPSFPFFRNLIAGNSVGRHLKFRWTEIVNFVMEEFFVIRPTVSRLSALLLGQKVLKTINWKIENKYFTQKRSVFRRTVLLHNTVTTQKR